MKKSIYPLLILCLLYSDCLYGIPTNMPVRDSLACVSPLSNPGASSPFERLADIVNTLDESDIRVKLHDLKVLFAQVLGDEPDGISIIYNRRFREVFVFSKNGIFHVYRDQYTPIPGVPIEEYSIGSLRIKRYHYGEDLLARLEAGMDLVLIEGLPEAGLTDSQMAGIAERHILGILRRTGNYVEGKDIRELIDSLPSGGLKDYLNTLLRLTQIGHRSITPAMHGLIPAGISSSGWLWKDGIPGLDGYSDTDNRNNISIEVRNALRIRNYILDNGRELPIQEFPIKIVVWDGEGGRDRDLNELIERNIQVLLSNLPDQERYRFLQRLKASVTDTGIVVAILDSSRHWSENCRGDGFIGINRYLLERIKDTLEALISETTGQNRQEVTEDLGLRFMALEIYLRTYLYHELRHEAFVEERRLLDEMIFDVEGLWKGISVEDMDVDVLKLTLDSLSPEARERFENELERRQNGLDAGYFSAVSRGLYEKLLRYLMESGILDMDSRFLHAVAIAGFSSEVPIGYAGYKHFNELTVDDFKDIDKKRIAKMAYNRYEAEYTEMYKLDKEGTESNYRGKIAYLLYCLGLNYHIRVDVWRQKTERQRQYDRELAKRYIIRLIDFISKHERYLAYLHGRGEVSIFRERETPISYREAAQQLMVSLLSSGDYSQAILRTELAFKTSGLANTVTTNKFEFWKLVEEACVERVNKGDIRFMGITAEVMKSASIEKEMLPRLRIVYLFRRYLTSLPGSKLPQRYKDILNTLCWKYGQYRAHKEVVFDDSDITAFDKLYNKVNKVLLELFGIEGSGWEGIFNPEEEDFLIALWNTFDLVENLVPDLDLYFTEPLISGDSGGIGFRREEIDDIVRLKKLFDKDMELIKDEDITSDATKRCIQMILRIYKGKVHRFREGLCGILSRYGTDRDLDGSRVWELMRSTRGWAGAVWLAREYGEAFRNGLIEMALEINSGLSVFYRALLNVRVPPDKLQGVTDLISNTDAEYFGENTNRILGDLVNGDWIDIKTGDRVEKEREAYQLITDIYNLHTITSPKKIYAIFREVNRLLKYGGHFAIVLPPVREFSKESLEVLREKMGFVPIVTPGVTWNELSKEAQEKIAQVSGNEALEKQKRELRKRRFYVIILEKVGKVKEGAEELQDKAILIPDVISDRNMGIPEEVREALPSEDIETEEPGIRHVEPEESEWIGCGVIDGMSLGPDEIAGSLAKGLEESQRLREKAENVGTIPEYQRLINELLEEEITPPHRLKDYVVGDLRERIDKALSYVDSDYTSEIEIELFNLLDELENLKRFILDHHDEFTKKIEWIKAQGASADRLSRDDRQKFQRVILFTKTDLNEETFEEVCYVYGRLLDIERQKGDKAESQRFIAENRDIFNRIKGLINKYQYLGEVMTSFEKRYIQQIIDSNESDLTPELLRLVNRIDSSMAALFDRRFSSLNDIEGLVSRLADWIGCEFFFNPLDMEFLSTLRDKWQKVLLDKGDLTFLRNNIQHLIDCTEVIELWGILKDEINWDISLARFFRDKEELEYMDVLDEELLYKKFIERNQITGGVVRIRFGMGGNDIKQKLIDKNQDLAIGQDCVVAIPECLQFTDRFLGSLDNLGFEVMNIFEVWLEYKGEIKPEVERFIRRGKRLAILRKKAESKYVVPDSLTLATLKMEPQDFSKWIEVREYALQRIEPDNLTISSREILTRAQIERLYPDWAGVYLGKGQWLGSFFPQAVIEAEAEAYRRKKEKEREREERLIKRLGSPLVGISYGGVWTESVLRDLAQILLGTISDFNNPTEIDTLLDNPIIKSHSILSKIPRDELSTKIGELIRYRQYDLCIERLYKEITRIMGYMAPASAKELDVHKNIDGIDWLIPLMSQSGNKQYWHVYNVGIGISPFGISQEEQYMGILGNYLASRRLGQDVELVVHYLSDPDNVLKRETGLLGRDEPVNRLYPIASGVIAKLSSIYTKKDLDEGYMKTLLDLAYLWMDYIYKESRLDKAIEISGYMLNNINLLLSGKMTVDEFGRFREESRKRLSVPEIERPRPSESEMNNSINSRKAFYLYMHGDGQALPIMVTRDDVIISKFADNKVRIKYYLDALFHLKSTRLYVLSNEEKDILNRLAKDLAGTLSEDVCRKVIGYIKATNSVNRYLYFAYNYLSYVWAQEYIKEANEFLDTIVGEIIETEPILDAYTVNRRELNIMVLLTELYRLKQMTGDISLTEEARLEVQFATIGLIELINKKSHSEELPSDLPRLKEEGISIADLIYELAAIGNPYHIDMTTNVTIGLLHLQQADEFDMSQCFEVQDDEKRRRATRYIIEELHLLFLYFPEEKDTALKNMANAIISPGSVGSYVKKFLDLFERYNPREARQLRGLLRTQPPKERPTLKKMGGLANRAINSILAGENVPEEVSDLISQDQGFRCFLLSVLDLLAIDNITQYTMSRGLFQKLIRFIMSKMQNPYEIYHTIKLLTTSTPEGGEVKVNPDIFMLGVERFVEFIKERQNEPLVVDILTRTYKQYITMADFIAVGLESNSDLRRYMAKLFVDASPIVSAYAYYYMDRYICKPRLKRGKTNRGREIHELFLFIIENLLGQGDRLDTARFKRLLELFSSAVVEEDGFTLKQEWDAIIGKFREGKISKETLLAMGRNAGGTIEDLHKELGDTGRADDIRNRFRLIDTDGENIFEKAVRNMGSAYFCEMTQGEINPQIKGTLEDPEEKDYCFVKGRSDEGRTGRLILPDGYKDMILSAVERLGSDLSSYKIVVLRGVNFSGHYGITRNRIYIPLEIIEIANREPTGVRLEFLEDFIEHEYLHTKGWSEEDIIARSNEKRPGVYEKARVLYRRYIAERLAESVQDTEGLNILKEKLEEILKKVQDGVRIELSEVQLHRLLWLIDRSKAVDIVPQIASLINLILEPNYTGDPGQVIMAVEKEILSFLYTDEQIDREGLARNVEDIESMELVTFIGRKYVAGEENDKEFESAAERLRRLGKGGYLDEIQKVMMGLRKVARIVKDRYPIDKCWETASIRDMTKGISCVKEPDFENPLLELECRSDRFECTHSLFVNDLLRKEGIPARTWEVDIPMRYMNGEFEPEEEKGCHVVNLIEIKDPSPKDRLPSLKIVMGITPLDKLYGLYPFGVINQTDYETRIINGGKEMSIEDAQHSRKKLAFPFIPLLKLSCYEEYESIPSAFPIIVVNAREDGYVFFARSAVPRLEGIKVIEIPAAAVTIWIPKDKLAMIAKEVEDFLQKEPSLSSLKEAGLDTLMRWRNNGWLQFNGGYIKEGMTPEIEQAIDAGLKATLVDVFRLIYKLANVDPEVVYYEAKVESAGLFSIEKLRDRLDSLGYGSKAEEIIRILQGLRMDSGRFQTRSDYEFVIGLEKLLGYRVIEYVTASLSDIRGNGDNSLTRHWADIFELNLTQWRVLESAKDKKPTGFIVQHIKDLGPGVQNWLEGIRRYNVDMSGVRMAFITDGITEEERQRLLALKPDNVVLVSNLEEIRSQTDNIVYLASGERLEPYKGQGLRLVEKGQTGPVIELSWCLIMLSTDDIGDAYRGFLNKLANLRLIDNDQVQGPQDPFYIKLPKVERVLEMWNELQKDTSYLETWV